MVPIKPTQSVSLHSFKQGHALSLKFLFNYVKLKVIYS